MMRAESAPRTPAQDDGPSPQEDGASVEDCELGLPDNVQPAELAKPTREVAAEPEGEKVGVKSRVARRRKVYFVVGFLALSVVVAIGTLLAVIWPRDPVWQVEKLSFDPDALQELIAVATGRKNSSNLPLNFVATVRVDNPNAIGAQAEAGTFSIRYSDSLLGTGRSEAVPVGPRSSVKLVANIVVQVGQDMAKALNELVVNNHMSVLPIIVDGEAFAQVSWLKIRCRAHCQVDADVLQLVQNPEAIVKDKSCRYTYGL